MTTYTLTTESETLSDGSEVYNLVFRDIDEDGSPVIMQLSAADYSSAMAIEQAFLGHVIDLDIMESRI